MVSFLQVSASKPCVRLFSFPYLTSGSPVTTVWRVLKLWMQERPPIWRVTANILNKQSRTADTGFSSSLGAGRCANNSSQNKRIMLRNVNTESLGSVLILWHDPNNGNIYQYKVLPKLPVSQHNPMGIIKLIFMDPCIVVWLSRNNQQDATL